MTKKYKWKINIKIEKNLKLIMYEKYLKNLLNINYKK